MNQQGNSYQDLSAELRLQLRFYLEESERKIERVWADFTEEQIWWRPNEVIMAPANHLLHLNGNLSQWVLSAIGRKPDLRQRDAEFSARGGIAKTEIWTRFQATLREVKDLLSREEDWMQQHVIQGHSSSSLGVWLHMIEHLSYHTAQLVMLNKWLLGREPGLYDNWDLNAQNQV